jgi:hypothetical protein
MNESDLIEYEGKRYKRIPGDQAFRIRCDIPLYMLSRNGHIGPDTYDPPLYRLTAAADSEHTSNRKSSSWWNDYNYCVCIDDDKSEYESNG